MTTFARQTVFTAVHWVRQHMLRRSSGSRGPDRSSNSRNSPMRRRPPMDPNILHVSMNPAMLQQQTTLDMLHLARQQRLEVLQAQQNQTLAEVSRLPASSLPRPAASFRTVMPVRQLYAPQRAPGSSV